MLYDICLGMISYVGISFFFDEPFRMSYFFLTVIFSLLPDIDFIFYLFLRTRLNLVTHWLLHLPLLFVVLGLLISIFSFYLATLFVVVTLIHLAHDILSEKMENYPQGIRILYPFSNWSLSWQNQSFVFLSESEQRSQLERRRRLWKRARKRNVAWEIRMRMEAISIFSWVLVGLSSVLVWWFASLP